MHGYIFVFNIQIDWPFYRNLLEQIPLVLALLYENCPLIFKRSCSFSKPLVLFSRLIYKCFITLFSRSIFDCNFDTFCSSKFNYCVLKSEYILLIIDWLFSNTWVEAFCWKSLTIFVKRFILDIWVLNKPLIVNIDCKFENIDWFDC